MTTTTGLLVQLVVKALTEGKTDAGERVYSPRSWSTWDGQYPVLLVRALHERKDSLGPASIEFDVTSTIRVTARLSSPAFREDEAAGEIEEALWDKMQRQIEIAVINSPILMIDPEGGDRLKHYPTIETVAGFNAEGKLPLGELMMDIGMQFYQGPEHFYQNQGTPLERVVIAADLKDVADPNGTYTPLFPYPVAKPPRAEGPDGRAEGALDIELPQT